MLGIKKTQTLRQVEQYSPKHTVLGQRWIPYQGLEDVLNQHNKLVYSFIPKLAPSPNVAPDAPSPNVAPDVVPRSP
jgi:hypothetical protein